MRMTAQPIEVAVAVQKAAWAGIAEELAIAVILRNEGPVGRPGMPHRELQASAIRD